MFSKNSIDNILIRIGLLFPSTVLLQGLPGLGWINKCIVAVLIVLMLWQMKDQRDVLLAGAVCGLLSIISLFLSNPTYLRMQDVFYYPLFVLYCLYWEKRSEEFGVVLQNNLKFVIISAVLWGLLVATSALFPSSIVHINKKISYFQSFATSPFRLASSCVMILLMMHILAYYKKPVFFLLEAVPMWVILSTGARTYLLVGVGIVFLSFYVLCKRKRVFWLSLIPMLAVMLVAVLNSSIVDKFEQIGHAQRALYGNYLDAVTSGRTIFWKLNLEAFNQLPFWRKLVGSGLSFSYEVTGTKYVSSIWSHNDYIHMLVSYGWIGLGLYFYSFFRFTERFRKTYSVRWLPYLGAVGVCMGNAFVNGLYFYSAAMLAMPFLLYSMSLDRAKKVEPKQ